MLPSDKPPAAPIPSPPFSISSLISSRYNPTKGKYLHLLSSVISLPSVLSLSIPASSFPLHFSLASLSLHLRLSSLSPSSLSSTIPSSRLKGASLTLPCPPLKLTLDSLHLALDSIYAPKRATFAYSGRHTAVKYIKNYIQNPTWWFKVDIPRQHFTARHVSRLLEVLSGKIDDPQLFLFVRDLFESDLVSIELGGAELGRGFPQESTIVPTLVNIYFDRVDRELQVIREEVHKRNPRLKEEHLTGNGSTSTAFHRPVRVYAIRYLDEIFVATSGSKFLTLDIRDRILHVLEGELGLKVDKLGSSVHSAVSEKIGFMGYEFQAVPPSVLYPPMSEKAIRARKKYLKMKAAKAEELKNARETRRKKLGLKILKQLFNRMKASESFDLGFGIEREVTEVFDEWAGETVKEYFQNLENRCYWHRLLLTGDFFCLDRIRCQLPDELVQSYDTLQEKVEQFLSHVRDIKSLEREQSRKIEEEERCYAKRTIDDLAELKIKVSAPIEQVRKAVKLAGFTNSMGRPRPIKLLIRLDDADIIKWYAGVGNRWLDFYSCCSNFKMVKTVVNYHLRFSCFLTLAEKHESTKRQAISHFTKDLKVKNKDGVDEIWFPTEREIKMMGAETRNIPDPKPVDGTLTMILVQLAVDDKEKYECVAHFCRETDTTILYRIRLLQNRLNVDPLNEMKWVPGLGAVHESLNKKCFPLCECHATELLLGKITLQDIDCTSYVDIE
ncbi:RNA-directed DNA polymerase [Rhynchospora pubera]|uniref:RNA-directed DNA polymerase n=1 Tax=Rhynchospora pubera TaxID=906938 RepID=A0AAV8DLC3_9POAL|nr:RNA-directed DNA polymerase [Rhynchospora pubera]